MMNTVLAFRKVGAGRNLLYDEFFLAAEAVEIIAFNFDGSGAALCRCDGRLQAIASQRLARIIFGVARERLQKFLTAIFDGDCYSSDLERQGEEPSFQQAELAAMSRYDRSNLAKHIAKELEGSEVEVVSYYAEV